MEPTTTDTLLAIFTLLLPILFSLAIIFIFSAKKDTNSENCEDKL
jgi:hypothetical protein